MPTESSNPKNIVGLIIRPTADLVALPKGRSSALSEIIDRSLAHLRTNQSLAALKPQPGEEREFEIAHGVMMRMCWIPPGEFLMGSPEDELSRYDDETQHRVTITRGFWLGKYEVTEAQWQAVTGSNPSDFKGAQLPVEGVIWTDISEPGGFLEEVNRVAAAGGRFSLPTEAQWEYACRAGTMSALNNGKNLTSTEGACRNLDEVGWYCENSGDTTHPGGLKRANAWGLHDMHGNLWEWCADWYGCYPNGPITDPLGPDSGLYRVCRGGGWSNSAGSCRAADRGNGYPSDTDYYFGFRLARSSVPLNQQGAERTEPDSK